jgi:hypothetical protein
VYIKQRKMEVMDDESWYQVSERIAAAFGLPRLSVFRLFPMDGVVTRLGADDGAYSFEWTEGRQYWWTNAHDPAKDRRTAAGREMKLVNPEGKVDTLAIYR